jgi:hypothetical protein
MLRTLKATETPSPFAARFGDHLERMHAHIQALDPEWNWTEFARQIGESRPHMWEYRKGRRFVSGLMLAKMVEAVLDYDGAVRILIEGLVVKPPKEDAGRSYVLAQARGFTDVEEEIP